MAIDYAELARELRDAALAYERDLPPSTLKHIRNGAEAVAALSARVTELEATEAVASDRDFARRTLRVITSQFVHIKELEEAMSSMLAEPDPQTAIGAQHHGINKHGPTQETAGVICPKFTPDQIARIALAASMMAGGRAKPNRQDFIAACEARRLAINSVQTESEAATGLPQHNAG